MWREWIGHKLKYSFITAIFLKITITTWAAPNVRDVIFGGVDNSCLLSLCSQMYLFSYTMLDFNNREHVHHLKVLGLLKGSLWARQIRERFQENERKRWELTTSCLWSQRAEERKRFTLCSANGQVRSVVCGHSSTQCHLPLCWGPGQGVEGLKGWPLPAPGTQSSSSQGLPGYQQRGRQRMDRKPGVGVGKVHSFSLEGHLRHRDPCLLDVFLWLRPSIQFWDLPLQQGTLLLELCFLLM